MIYSKYLKAENTKKWNHNNVPKLKGFSGSAMVWGTFSCHGFSVLTHSEGKVNVNHDLALLSDYLHHMLNHVFPAVKESTLT